MDSVPQTPPGTTVGAEVMPFPTSSIHGLSIDGLFYHENQCESSPVFCSVNGQRKTNEGRHFFPK